MARVIVAFNGKYANIEAEEFHEDDGYIKVYSEHNELLGMFKTEIVDYAYITQLRKED